MPLALPAASLLAEATLGAPAKGALVTSMVVAVLLLIFGARLLRPAVVLALMLTGFVIAVVVARNQLPEVPLWIAAAVGAVAGLVAGALLYRPAVGIVAGGVGAAIGALVAWAVIAGGSLDTAPRDLGHALVDSPREVSTEGEGERAGLEILHVLAGPHDGADAAAAPQEHRSLAAAASDAAARTADAALPVGERLLRDAADTVARANGRLRTAIDNIAPAYRTLLLAAAAAGAIAGFLAGLIATTTVARILTSFAGAWLLLVTALPLLALHGYEPMPADARVWLVTLAVLALLGVITQSVLGAAPPRTRKVKPAAGQPAGDTTAA